jgi:drug/metabolite transporter (DMT)-like permease
MASLAENSVPGIPTYLVLFSGILAISTGAIFARLADAPSLVIAAYRVGLASLLLLPIACYKTLDELQNLSIKDLGSVALSGLFLAMHFAAWISSLKYTSIANSVVLVNMSPLWVGILAPLLLQEKIRRTTILGILLSLAGCIVIGSGDLVVGGKTLWGDFLAVLGGFCMAGYLMMGKKLRQKISLIGYVALCYSSAAIILWIVVLLLGLKVSGFSGQTMAAFWSMAIISQVIGHSCYNWALRYCTTSLVALSLLGEPVGSSILAYFLFHEQLTLIKSIGGLLILSAIYLAARGEKNSPIVSS